MLRPRRPGEGLPGRLLSGSDHGRLQFRVRGRPPKLTPEVATAITKLIADGVPYSTAAEACGVSKATLSSWLRKGSQLGAKAQYRELVAALKKAKAKGIAARVKRIASAAKEGAWQADAWWLERQVPEQFAINKKETRELLKLAIEQGKQIAELEARLGKSNPENAGAEPGETGQA